jgi:hypothetical protein
MWWGAAPTAGQERVDLLGQYRDHGVSRVMTLLRESANQDDALASLADDARAAGVELA